MDQSPDEPRRITVDEAMALALECFRNDQLKDAEALCRKILEVAPGHVDAMHYFGVLAHRGGRSEEGLAMIRRSLELAPDQPDWHSNLGIVLQAAGDLEGAMAAFARAIALRPEHANAHSNLGVLLRVHGRLVEAEAEYRTAIALQPAHADAYHNLAILLDLTNRTPEAVTAYCKALTLRPEYPEARRLLALAYCAIGEPDKAVLMCEEWVRNEPDDPMARHTMAAVSGRDVPLRASDDYVRKTFDGFSASFEAKLARLHYKAPELVMGILAGAGLESRQTLDVLDAGCGTGLCGPLLAPYARRLVGIDLSDGMLEHAREKQVYDELVAGELTAHMQARPQAYDVIVTADTLCYFGALEEVVAAAAAALRPGGVLAFTVEEATDAAAAADIPDYRLLPHGRYHHRADYVERLLKEAGLQPVIERGDLRREQGLPVAGLVVRATKASGDVTVDRGQLAGTGVSGEHHV